MAITDNGSANAVNTVARYFTGEARFDGATVTRDQALAALADLIAPAHKQLMAGYSRASFLDALQTRDAREQQQLADDAARDAAMELAS